MAALGRRACTNCRRPSSGEPSIEGNRFCVRQRHREGIDFLFQDLRSEAPGPLFDLVLCRYVAFTYFARCCSARSWRIVERLLPNGYL
jgi:chemotaxis protein methyltransferase CheR